MGTDWNQKRLCHEGHALSWDERDDIQRLLAILQVDAVEVFNTALEYDYVLDFTTKHLPFADRAPHFWGEVVKSLRFTLIMKTARLFDESSDAIGLNKAFNILEQSRYNNLVKNELKQIREQYDEYHKYINEIRTIRDKVYAHNDRREYRFWKKEDTRILNLEFEGEFWNKLEEILIWARDSILCLRSLTGDSYPVNREITNDLENLLINEQGKEA